MFTKSLVVFFVLVAFLNTTIAQTKPAKPRARDLGIPFDGTPAALNAITDVAGVEVGQITLISGEGINGNTVYAIPHERLKEVLRKYNRLN